MIYGVPDDIPKYIYMNGFCLVRYKLYIITGPKMVCSYCRNSYTSWCFVGGDMLKSKSIVYGLTFASTSSMKCE